MGKLDSPNGEMHSARVIFDEKKCSPYRSAPKSNLLPSPLADLLSWSYEVGSHAGLTKAHIPNFEAIYPRTAADVPFLT